MSGKSSTLPSAIAVVTGIASWEVVRQFSSRREAWDDPLYWMAAFPAMILAAFLLGLIWREHSWRWGALMVAAQAAWSLGFAFLRDGVPNLLPLGLAMFALLSLPLIAASLVGSRVGRAFSRGTPQMGG